MHYNNLIYYALSFSAVVKAQSFSQAAKNTGISKAQLSRHVAALENLLGIQLMLRTTRQMSLTQEGKQFFASCKLIEESCNEAFTDLKNESSHLQGTLRITAPIDFGIQFLPSIIREYRAQYPYVNVVVSLSNANENLLEENYDIAIRIANDLPASSLRMRTLMKFKRIICAAPAYFKNHRKLTNPKDLKNHLCITSVNRQNHILYPQWSLIVNNKIIKCKLERVIEIDSLFAQRELILSGTGIGRLPDYFIRKELQKKNLN